MLPARVLNAALLGKYYIRIYFTPSDFDVAKEEQNDHSLDNTVLCALMPFGGTNMFLVRQHP
jgi:hypothetical protein